MKKKKREIKIFLKSTDDEISLVCNSTPVIAAEQDSVKPSGAYCSLVKSFCKSENCGSCKALSDHAPGHQWVCTECADTDNFILYPFWEDTSCEICGIDYGVMICVKQKKYKR